MDYELTCSCGAVHAMSVGMAGSSFTCSCGRAIAVPPLGELGNQEITSVAPQPILELRPPEEPASGPDALAEILAPTEVTLRTHRDGMAGRAAPVVAALSADALWIQDVWQLRQFPLSTLSNLETRQHGRELALNFGSEASGESLQMTFVNARVGERWYRELQARQRQPHGDGLAGDVRLSEGVALVRHAGDVPYESLGRVGFTGASRWRAERGLQVRAGMRGADAVIEWACLHCPELGWAGRNASGLAVRVADADARGRLRLIWYSEAVCSLVNRMLLLLFIQAALIFVVTAFWAGGSALDAPTGETRVEALKTAGLGFALFFTWPFLLLALLRILRWPQLLRIVGLAVLAITTGRGLTVWAAHLAAVFTTGVALKESKAWILADPVDWAFVIIGMLLCVRAWRLAGEARHMLPPEMQSDSTSVKTWARGLAGATIVFTCALLGFAAMTRYETSAYVLHPGFDPKREQEAFVAFNEGMARLDKGELDAAAQSFERSLRLSEELTKGRSAPSRYLANLALTLNNLGWVRDRQGRSDDAERYYARAVAVADQLAGNPDADDEFKKTMEGARAALAGLRSGKSVKLLDDKDQAAVRKYEEAQVKALKGAAEAEGLFEEAIKLWEEVLPHADNPEYRKGAFFRLALAYLHLGELQQQKGKRTEAEAAVKKAIENGEKAVSLDPDRPLPKHNLEVARQMLEGLHEQALQEEINKLCETERFADAFDVCVRSIEEQEERLRWGKDHDAAKLRLAYCVDRFAWFLAHCPDQRVRDTKEAVKQARRATELQPGAADYWYTLAMVQYRNGDWRDSLASIEKVKAKEGGLEANGWLLSAMDLHQLKQRKEARAAFQKADEWIDERKRHAEENAQLRFQYEMMRPAIEALRREAQNLLEGKDPSDAGKGIS